jgi:hypothetical protein
MRFVVEVITIVGDLPEFLGASSFGSAFSAPVVSVFMSVVLKGAKKLRVNADFGGILAAADVGTGLIDFLSPKYDSRYAPYVYLLAESSRAGPLNPLTFCSLYHFVLPVHVPSGRPSVHLVLPCTCHKERYKAASYLELRKDLLCSPPRHSQWRSTHSLSPLQPV